jgi:hypothetical protein
MHEQAGDEVQALAAYQQAYRLVRSVYPMYAGVKAAIGSGSRVNLADAEECLLVRELVETLHRLAPDSMPLPQGGIAFDVVGIDLPPTVHVELVLELCEPSIRNPDEGLPTGLPRLLPLCQDQPVSATLLDGTYRLHKSGHHLSWDNDADRLARLVQVDVEGWPSEIQVQGSVIKLPPVRLRIAEAIERQLPDNGAAVDLSDVELRWSPVAQADFYRVHLDYRKEAPQPSAVMFLATDVKLPRLRFSELSANDQAQVRENLTAGRTGAWRVDAYDAAGRCIGLTLSERRFLVAAELHAP